MSVIVDFELRFKELLSNGLQRLRPIARSVFGGIDEDVAKTKTGLSDLGREVRPVVDMSGIKEAHEQVEKLHSSLNELGGRSGHGSMGFRDVLEGTMLGGLAVEGIRRAIDKGREEVKEVFGSGMEAGMTKMELNVMAGGKAGQELYEGTKKFISTSMFGPELFGQDKLLLGYGEKAKNILKDIREEGDISMGDPMKMESLTEAMGKTIMRGKFDMFEMRQLATTGFNPVQELHRKTGESTASLMHKMKEGAFTIDMYREAMEAATSKGGRFYEMQKKIMETPGGKYKQFTTNITLAKEELGLALLPALGGLMEKLGAGPLGKGLPKLMDELVEPLGKMITGFGDLLPAIQQFGGGLMAVLRPVGSFFISDEFKGLAKNILSLSGTILTELGPALKGLGEVAKDVTGALNWFIDGVKGDLANMKASADAWANAMWYKPGDKYEQGEKEARERVSRLGGYANDHVERARQHRALEELLNKAYIASVKNRILPVMPKSYEHALKKRQEAYDKMFGEANKKSDEIVGGGPKKIDIHIKSFAEHFEVHANGLKDAAVQSKEVFMRMFLETVQSANAAM